MEGSVLLLMDLGPQPAHTGSSSTGCSNFPCPHLSFLPVLVTSLLVRPQPSFLRAHFSLLLSLSLFHSSICGHDREGGVHRPTQADHLSDHCPVVRQQLCFFLTLTARYSCQDGGLSSYLWVSGHMGTKHPDSSRIHLLLYTLCFVARVCSLWDP